MLLKFRIFSMIQLSLSISTKNSQSNHNQILIFPSIFERSQQKIICKILEKSFQLTNDILLYLSILDKKLQLGQTKVIEYFINLLISIIIAKLSNNFFIMKGKIMVQNQELDKTKHIQRNHNNYNHQPNPYYQIQINYIAKEQSTQLLQFNTDQTPSFQPGTLNQQKFNNIYINHKNQIDTIHTSKKSQRNNVSLNEHKSFENGIVVERQDKKQLPNSSPSKNVRQKTNRMSSIGQNQYYYTNSNAQQKIQAFNFSKTDRRSPVISGKKEKFVPKFIQKKKQRQLDANIPQISFSQIHSQRMMNSPEFHLLYNRLIILQEHNKKLAFENQFIKKQLEWFQNNYSTTRISSQQKRSAIYYNNMQNYEQKPLYSSRINNSNRSKKNKQSILFEDIFSNRSWKSRSIDEQASLFNFQKHEKRNTINQDQNPVLTDRDALKCQFFQRKCHNYQQIIKKMQIKIQNLTKQNKKMIKLQQQSQDHREKLQFLQGLVEKIIEQYEGLEMTVSAGDQEWENIKLKWEEQRQYYRKKIAKMQGYLKVPKQNEKKSLQQSAVTLLSRYQAEHEQS